MMSLYKILIPEHKNKKKIKSNKRNKIIKTTNIGNKQKKNIL